MTMTFKGKAKNVIQYEIHEGKCWFAHRGSAVSNIIVSLSFVFRGMSAFFFVYVRSAAVPFFLRMGERRQNYIKQTAKGRIDSGLVLPARVRQ